MLMILLSMIWMTGFSFLFSFIEVILMFYFLTMIFFTQMNWSVVGGIGIFLGMDLVGFMLVELSLWIGILMFIASLSLSIFFEKMYKFYMLVMILLLMFCFLVMNLMGFYLFFESVLIPIIMMIMGWGGQPERLQAGIYMLFYTLGGSLPLLIYLLSFSESVSIFYMAWENYNISWLFFLMGVSGFMVKMPMFFVHLWLPKAHVEAPVAGSMVLAGVLLKLGIYGMFRIKMMMSEKLLLYGHWFVSIILIGGMIVGMICLCQVDVKSLIAYSSVCHMGMALGGIFSMVFWGYLGNIMIMLGHGLCSSGLFCLANMFYERFFTRSMILLSGVGIFFPYISLWWFLFSSINMAAPPSMNLGGEILLIGSLIKWSFLVVVPLSIVMFFSTSYSIYMYSYLNHGKGWVVYGNKIINFRELYLMLMHFLPLILWIMKMELFCYF
uniref:NADH dehydrogenase subunit 4 n=1 Tax=Alectorobius puertoricensis TaxID=48824 RepID=UPI002237181A|nr:NADH dehydrogenase subunit 4 [Alectorobius puertoricensis]UYB78543.1 NADH dehydrogenase subunit 4 [Alectorobius puertoricensis]UYB78556.1 NADH dehydrogenase subunit 4 [Alectorobius puertoricensis]